MSLTRLTSQKFIKVNSHRLNKVLMCKSKVLNKLFCMRHSVEFGQNKLNLFSQEIIFRKYSTQKPRVLGGLGVSDVNNEKEDKTEKHNGFYYDVDSIKHEGQKDEEIPPTREMIFEEIANGDADILKKLKLLDFEMAVLREQGMSVVNNPTKSQWKELLKNFDAPFNTKLKILSFMALNEKSEFYKLKKKDNKMRIRLMKREEAGFHFYGVTGHSILPSSIYSSLNKLVAFRSLMANQKIVIDCSYDKFMNQICQKNLAKQIKMCITELRTHRYPCQLEFCNLHQNSPFGEIIQRYVKNIFNEDFLCNVSAEDVVDVYPTEKLVYLTPHAPNDLIEINKDDIYIIGGFVDKGTNVKVSLAKAKEAKLRMARLPLDLYLFWKQGIKTLPINIVLKVMLDMMFYNDWNTALKSITSRSVNDTFKKRNYEIGKLNTVAQAFN